MHQVWETCAGATNKFIMCGITGIFTDGSTPKETLERCAHSMGEALAHRGPDDSGVWADARAGIAFSHRRLAILDLSPNGHQPMRSRCGRFVVCYNGEIYNHLDLRKELHSLGHVFTGESDTETLLAAVQQWGLHHAIEQLTGMFAFALWDTQTQALHLVRDRLGIKPLYYGYAGGSFVFGSELKALKAHPQFHNEIDRDSLALYFRHNYIPAPHSIYQGIHKLQPGSIMTVTTPSAAPTISTYWSAADTWKQGAASPLRGDEDAAADTLESLLADAVGIRMLADVPLGVFLSGGVDSSTIAALAQRASTKPVRTFAIGFADSRYDEAKYAAQVARHLGTDHTELTLTPQDLLDTIPLIPKYWDEPFADSSQIPTYCLAKMTRQHVTVALSGDGGDELFSGYTRYHVIDTAWSRIRAIPYPIRRALTRLAAGIPEKAWTLLGSIGPKLHWRLNATASRDFYELYHNLVSHTHWSQGFVLGAHTPATAFTRSDLHDIHSSLDRFQTMALLDLQTYLPDDILTKVDRASMAVALEARVPLLDHRVVEFAAHVPSAWKTPGGGKHLLRKVLYRHVPRALIDRPKAGFTVPIDIWMRTELRDWCEAMLDERTIREQGYIDAAHVRRMWKEYCAGQRNWFSHLWNVLMFQAWLEETR